MEERAKEEYEEETGLYPFKDLPEWFYDDEPISKDDIESDDDLAVYSGIQRYLGKNISKKAVDEFLIWPWYKRC